ncbi:hypothetical protein AYI70_g7219 [Smittium culicis]|uniref:Uncharacterized protein n=1 Tax=Smittium culicis TaxID=133412 RepID=A0A1R1XLJ7_9FUNG|nr:hypothetical protein AYI70_g7219 [Smittium culicis]
MCPYAFSQCPKDPASGPDTLLEGQPSCLFCRFSCPSSTDGLQTGYFVVPDQVGLLVGGVDFLALQGHISGQLPAYSHYPALGGIHSHFPSVRPFGYGVQCGL